MFSFSETATQAQSSPWFEHILSKRQHHQEYLQICVYYFSEKLNFSTHNHYKWKYCKSALSCYKEKLWNHMEWTYFWRVFIIWDLCVAAVAVPPPRSSCCCYSLWGRRGALCGDGLRFVLNGGRPHCALVKGAPNQVGPPKAILIIAPSKKEEQSMQASLLLLLTLWPKFRYFVPKLWFSCN